MARDVKPLIGGQEGLSLLNADKSTRKPLPSTNPTAFTPQTDFRQSIKLGTKQAGTNKYLDAMQRGLRGLNRVVPENGERMRQRLGVRRRPRS